MRLAKSLISEKICLGLLLALGLGLSAGAASSFNSCTNSLYVGFDSRLSSKLLGHLRGSGETIRGFEIVKGKTVVAFAHRVIAFGKGAVATMPSLDPIDAMSVDAMGRLRLQSPHKIQLVGESRMDTDEDLTRQVSGRLFNSGSAVFLEAQTEGEVTHFVARRPDGNALPLIAIEGQLRAASWNREGLAAVVGQTLLLWSTQGKTLRQLASDRGLRSTVDVCMVGPRSAVVSLRHVVLLISDRSQLVLVGFPALCRWENEILYLLDLQHGIVWSIHNLEDLADPRNDDEYATRLVKALHEGAGEDDIRFLEAARILGCDKARNLLASARGK